MARRDDREYREYLREEQRRQRRGPQRGSRVGVERGCIAVRMQMELHHGLLGAAQDFYDRRQPPFRHARARDSVSPCPRHGSSWDSHAQQPPRPAAPAIDADDIGGVVTGPNGPEAGVWVIAETRDLPVRYIKIVVTDDRGPLRRSRSAAGALQRLGARLRAGRQREVDERARASIVNITATPAPTPADAAHYYPAIYWYSMLKIPTADRVGGNEQHSPAT